MTSTGWTATAPVVRSPRNLLLRAVFLLLASWPYVFGIYLFRQLFRAFF